MALPIPFNPAVEEVSPDEMRTASDLTDTMRSIQETTLRDYGHAVRSVHAKSHGLIEGHLEIRPDLPSDLAQGLFSRPGRYPVVMRFSTNPGDILDDSVSAPRGLGLKVIGVDGERLPGSEGDVTQDFVMANAPAFAAPTPAAFAKNLKLLAATTDTGQGWKKAFSAALRGAEAVVEAAGSESAMLKTLGGQPIVHPLGDSFFTQTPLLYGDYVAKIAVVPVSPELTALVNQPVDVAGRPNGLREEIITVLREHGGEWELRVQLRTNAATMPVEDASVPWPEDESPYRPVARIRVPPQPAWNEERARAIDDELAFSPWHGLAAHRPLGAVNRARRQAYRAAASFRASRNGCPIHEPHGALHLSNRPARAYGSTPGREGRRLHTPSAPQRGSLFPSAVRPVMVLSGGIAAGLLLATLLRRTG